MALTYRVINNLDIVTEYIDDYLYNRLKDDSTKSVDEFIVGGIHLGFYMGDRLVGIITLIKHGSYYMAHPKFRRSHMIYAKRCCLTGLLYLQELGATLIMLLIPDIFISNIKMANACGFSKRNERQESIFINGIKVGVTAYGRVIPEAEKWAD